MLDRLTGINYPDCVALGVCTSTVHSVSHTYSDAGPSPSVTTTILLQAGQSSVSETVMDGFGHVVQTQLQSAPGGTEYVVTAYDGTGHVWTASNPYQTTTDPSYGITTTTYDALGRTTNVAYPDGTGASTTYSVNCSAHPADCSTVTDAAGKTRQLWTDALGRLTSVLEDPNGLGYSTAYSFDALGDLSAVTQGPQQQTRSFTHDSLGRLVASSNPENGGIGYVYDPNGNVTSRTDARGSTYYTYDALNRVLTKSYSDTTTARACYAYDGQYGWGDTMINAVGHLTSSWSLQHDGTVLAANEFYQFDQMGRLQLGRECTPATCGLTSYSLSAANNLLGSETGKPENRGKPGTDGTLH